MIELFRDRYRVGLALATLFLLGIIVSIYMIYSIPHNLMLNDGYQGTLTNVYLVVGATFLLGGVTIWNALRYKNEIIVYKDKQLEQNLADQDNFDSNLTTISLESVKANLKQAK